LAQLQLKAKQQKQRAAATASESDSKTESAIDPGASASSGETQPDEGFSDLQARAKQMRQRRNADKKIEEQDLSGK
ncbi:MAG: CHASE2 domain-containing protein, partial [Microcoleus sp. PH2017_06_SFM_O_A]|nr:CHASE2 domain-containing protein [Microcoleus sp. PH2017_06_SFM_O_A]